MPSTPRRRPCSAAVRSARGAAASVLTLGATVAFAAVTAAQPPAPPPPSPLGAAPAPPPPAGPLVPVLGTPLGSAGLHVLAQRGTAAAGPLGVPAVPGIDRTTVLGQNALPSAPGAAPGLVPDLWAFNNAYGVPQYRTPSAPGEGTVFDVAPGHENDNVNAREWLGRMVDLYRDGRLDGALLGQAPHGEPGVPLPKSPFPEASAG